ncbi:hypothetical protein SALBM217S_00366 [Streptomyces griseoloalbus]
MPLIMVERALMPTVRATKAMIPIGPYFHWNELLEPDGQGGDDDGDERHGGPPLSGGLPTASLVSQPLYGSARLSELVTNLFLVISTWKSPITTLN